MTNVYYIDTAADHPTITITVDADFPAAIIGSRTSTDNLCFALYVASYDASRA